MRADDLGLSSLEVRRTRPRLCLMRLSADLLRNPVGRDRFVAQLPEHQPRAMPGRGLAGRPDGGGERPGLAVGRVRHRNAQVSELVPEPVRRREVLPVARSGPLGQHRLRSVW